MKLRALFLITIACLVPTIHAQKNFWDSPKAYLGQPRPSDIPRVFAPGLLTDPGDFVMDRVAFSPDGKEFYYQEANAWYKLEGMRIKFFKYDGHQWNGPTVLNQHFGIPTLSPDGRTFYFCGGKSCHEVWISKRTKDGWTTPVQFLDEPYDLYDFMPSRSGVFYVGSDPDSEDKKMGITESVSRFTLSNRTATIKSLGLPLNEPGFNGDLYVAPDESYMIVSAKETKDGESELFISFHKPDQTWTVPVSLGPKINNGLAHRWGQYVTPDGKYLFYSWGTSEKDCAIYWVRFDKLLASLRPKQS